MRLTLRTLLAYLDDILEPAQAKEIGAKIAESDFASSLSNRIREVMRRRRLTAPELVGPSSGIDPNVVAEYLDNTLSADLVADLEKICLDSDVHLAEVAASHQILTLVLGEPVEISNLSRERMYALAPPAPAVDPAGEQEWTGEPTPPQHSNGDEAPPVKPARPIRSLSETIPDYLKPKPLWKRMIPYITVLALVAAFFGLVLTDKGLFPHLFSKDTTVANNDAKSPPGLPIPGGQPRNNPPETKPGQTPANTTKPRTDNGVPKNVKDMGMPSVAGIDRQPPPDQGEKRSPDGGNPPVIVENQPPVALPKTPNSKQNSVAGMPPAKSPSPPMTKQPTKPTVVAGNAPTLSFNPQMGRGLLLRESTQSRDWQVLTGKTALKAKDHIVSPEPFDSQIEVNRGRSLVTLTAGTSVRILPPSAAAVYGFELRHGRIVVRSKTIPMVGETDERVFSLIIRGETWRVELLTPDSVCGIEMVPKTEFGFETTANAEAFSGAVFAQTGSVRVANRQGDVVVVNGDDGSCGRLTLAAAEMNKKDVRRLGPIQQVAIPSWLTPAGRRKSEQIDRYAALYRKKFESAGNTLDALGGKGISMRENVAELILVRRPLVAEFAMQALAATDSYADLVQSLSRTQHEEARKVAVNGLRRWLASNPDNRKLLKVALAKTWPRPDAEAVYRLLWGFTETDGHDAKASHELVEWLGHSHVAIRELAFENIYRLTKRKHGYHPLHTLSQRRIAISSWKNHLNKHGALLPPDKID